MIPTESAADFPTLEQSFSASVGHGRPKAHAVSGVMRKRSLPSKEG